MGNRDIAVAHFVFRSEHFQEKACPGLDPGWKPVSVRKCDKTQKLESAFSFRRN
jgi:hypothetical protein